MGEFRIGRKHARHVYPDNPRAASLGLFARNYAIGPTGNQSIAAGPNGTLIPWTAIEAGPASGTTIQITPRVTGIIRVIGAVSVQATDTASVVQVKVVANGIDIPVPFVESTVDGLGFETIPISAETPAGPIGVPGTISVRVILVSGGASVILSGSASLAIQEVSPATG